MPSAGCGMFFCCCSLCSAINLAGLFVSGRKSVLYAAVAVNLGILGIFKYLTFLVQTVDRLPGVTIPVPSIVLPVGISFFTFQGLSYVIDVYRNERLKSTHFRDVLLYIALFPQLVAGPIIRYEDVADEIHSRRNTLEQLAKGLRRFIVGLSKKLLIADICGNVVALIYTPTALCWTAGRLGWPRCAI